MWYLKGFLFLILIFVLAFFFIENSGQAVDLKFLGHTYLEISVYWVVACSFLVGFLASFVTAAFREFKLHRRLRGMRKELDLRCQEIAELRALPLDDRPAPADNSTDAHA